MKGVLAFIFALCFMGAFSLPYESWNMPVWPVAVMSLAVGFWITLIPGLEKYRIPLAVFYFIVFALMWLQSFPRPITPRATLHYARGLVWLATYTFFGLIAFFVFVTTLAKAAADSPRRKAVIYALLALALGAGIAFFSGAAGGSDPLMGWLQEHGLSARMAELTTIGIRKGFHFVFYGMLALIAGLSAFHGQEGKKGLKPAIVGFLFMLIHACFDESRQTGVSVRTGSVIDVIIDSAGAAFFLWVAFGRGRSKK